MKYLTYDFSDEEYPYTSGHTGRTGNCDYDAESQTASVYNRGYETLPHNDYEVFMNHVATIGPLAISADASRWSFYSHGVFDGCSYDKNIEINHAIQVNILIPSYNIDNTSSKMQDTRRNCYKIIKFLSR